ncbi:MAG: riboflavin synthase [Gammaproteobacteria bacterium]|nr:riboflavin synthase [Gammaproteobacteria bacterium]
MFTGIVQAVGEIISVAERGDVRLHISFGEGQPQLGDSIAVSGVCLTVTAFDERGFFADVSRETLCLTTLRDIAAGDKVNLEPALTLSQPLGGHLISGHVDGVGEVIARDADARSERLTLRAPENLRKYIARKGSICVDGVSLTVNQVEGADFAVNIVPHTIAKTTIGEYRPGRKVNLEVDMVARYLERLLQESDVKDGIEITWDNLKRYGFVK